MTHFDLAVKYVAAPFHLYLTDRDNEPSGPGFMLQTHDTNSGTRSVESAHHMAG
jgi:hypothetical protein